MATPFPFSAGQVLTAANLNATADVPRVLAYRNADLTITSLSYNTITFDAEAYDTHGMHSTVTNTSRLTIPTGWGGYYLLTAGGALNTGTMSITFLVNGIRFGYSGQLGTVGGGSFLIPATAGAYLEWSGYSISATTLYGSVSIGGYASSLSAVWVAPL